MIDRATVQKIKDTADIVDVVSDYVHLVRRGSNFMGLCPFHNERTPSFSVSKSRNYCYCFSCHKGGSPVNFIMEKEGISYHDALLQLAKKYGIKVEETELTDEEREAQSRKESMYVANEWAMQHFEKNLRDTEDGRNIGLQYLYGRGVTDEAIKQFHLGYALDRGGYMMGEALKKGFDINILKTIGLVGTSQQGYEYDRFRGRVIFPVLNSSGKVVAFGGRDLKGGPSKYVNSPESELYKKSNELYGMFQARAAIVREDKCYLVEGYLDVIGMWQSGMKNVVASSGTALTDGQINLIHRFTRNVTLIYDGDAAGIKASLRGIDMLLSHEIDVKVLLLPDGDDPDSFSRKHTPEEFKDYVDKNETDIIKFKTRLLIDEAENDPQKRVQAVRSVVQSLACIPDKVKRDVYVQECSRILNVPEESVGLATGEARKAVVEQLKKERRLKELDKDLREGRIVAQTDSSLKGETGFQGDSSNFNQENVTVGSVTKSSTVLQRNSLKPLEWDVLSYCIRYGCMDFCEAENEDGEKFMLTVAEYVEDELTADEVDFTTPSYREIFRILLDMVPGFREKLAVYKTTVDREVEQLRKSGFEEIGARDLSMAEIRREEKLLEERVKVFREIKIKDFSKNYPSLILASHENDNVRRITTEAISERHTLSRIYSREKPIETEVDKLDTLLPTALSVWKNGILDIRFNSLISELREASHNPEEERRLQIELSELMMLRSELAKSIGDRIINPSRQKGRRTPL